jgi:hypothetical protein
MVREIDLTQDAPKTHQDRDKRDRIRRLHKRLVNAGAYSDVAALTGIIKGILDLLADEL